MEVLGKNHPVRIAAPGNAETGQLFFSLRIFPRSCMDLPEAGELLFCSLLEKASDFNLPTHGMLNN